MVDLAKYFTEHPDTRKRMQDFALLALSAANSGPDFAACAHFLVGTGLVGDLGDALFKRAIEHAEKIADSKDGPKALQEAASLGKVFLLIGRAGERPFDRESVEEALDPGVPPIFAQEANQD